MIFFPHDETYNIGECLRYDSDLFRSDTYGKLSEEIKIEDKYRESCQKEIFRIAYIEGDFVYLESNKCVTHRLTSDQMTMFDKVKCPIKGKNNG